jgi:surface protein
VYPVDRSLNSKDTLGEYCIGLPRIYTDANNYSFNYSKVEITKTDGTITSNLMTKCNEIEKVKIWYPGNTYGISFYYPYISDTDVSVVKSISYCNTSNFVCMINMFSNCSLLQSLDVSNWDTSNVTNVGHMFYKCNNIIDLDLSNFDVSNIASMSCIFKDCTSLQSLDLSNWDVSKVPVSEYGLDDMFGDMFNNCTSLHTLHLDNCNNETLKRIINHGDLPRTYIDGVTKTIYCKKSQLSGVIRPGSWIYSYVYEEEPDVPDIPEEPDTSTVPYMEYTVVNTYDSKMLGEKYYDKNTGADGCYGLPRVYTNASNYSYTGYDDIEIVLKDDTIANKPSYVSIANTSKVKLWFPENTYSIKFSPSYITSDGHSESSRVNDLTYINYSDGVTNMSYMFQYCTYLTKCNFDCDTSNVTDMSGMFTLCTSLIELDLSNWDTSNVTNMSGMFQSCSSLERLDLSNFNGDKLTNTNWMFNNCKNLHTLRLDNCNSDTISKIISKLPTDNLEAPRTIYCSRAAVEGLTAPTNWQFSYID